MMTAGDLGDLGRSHARFRLWQPLCNSGTTGPIETITAPVDSTAGVCDSWTRDEQRQRPSQVDDGAA